MRILLILALVAGVTLAIICRDRFYAAALLAVIAFLPRLIGMLRRSPMIDTEEFWQHRETAPCTLWCASHDHRAHGAKNSQRGCLVETPHGAW
jgi:hypothetical protein